MGVAVALVAFTLGVVTATVTRNDVGRAPAIDVARDLGVALPVEQQPAFTDGKITTDEVKQATERLGSCAAAAGVTGFKIELTGDSYTAEWSLDADTQTVEACQRRHFDATYQVWLAQALSQPNR